MRRIIGISLILLAVLIWNVPGAARAAGNATLKAGKEVNAALKQLVNSSATYEDSDSKIKSIEWNIEAQNDETGRVDISASGSDQPIYISLAADGETVYIYSDADTIHTIGDASYMFYWLWTLEEIDSDFMRRLDTSDTTNMSYMFGSDLALQDIDVSSFDTSKVTDVSDMFYRCESLAEIDLSNFNLYNVRGLYGVLYLGSCPLLTKIETPYNTYTSSTLHYDDYRQLYSDNTQSAETYDAIPSGLTESITLVRDYDVPIVSPTPTAVPTSTSGATATPTGTPTSSTTSTPSVTPTRTATPTRIPTSSTTATARATSTSTSTPTLVTPVRTATATAISTTRTTATPTATAAGATPTSTPTGSGTTSSSNTGTTSGYYNPYAVVRSGNAYDMPRTGDGDAARLIAVAVFFIVGCIILVSSFPAKRRH